MRILLHACCGPCSLEPTRIFTQEGDELVLFYSNSNMDTTEEFDRRYQTFATFMEANGYEHVCDPYDPQTWEEEVAPHGLDRESRCRACYRLRFERAALAAKEYGCEGLSSTLSVSPYQFTSVIEEELERAACAHGLKAVFRDFRPYYREATARSYKLEMYRQNYCGCRFSKIEAEEERAQRKAQREEEKLERARAREALKAAQGPALQTEDFAYNLPDDRIAQAPADPRDSCKLLVLHKESGEIEHKVFHDVIDYLNPGDVLVVNETRVMPARLLGFKSHTGGHAECLLLSIHNDIPNQWKCLVKPGRRLAPGAEIDFYGEACSPEEEAPNGIIPVLHAKILERTSEPGQRVVELTPREGLTLDEAIHEAGKVPLPPYITQYHGNMELYQTVYAHDEASAAAPTAGLHFTNELLERIEAKGVTICKVNLEVGIDTFRPVTEKNPRNHKIHTERYSVTQEVIDEIQACKARGGRVIAVGTTSVRSLESAAQSGELKPALRQATSLYILPGYKYKVVDALITNFHVPRSTLMMLVSAFSSREMILGAYNVALENNYRFLSFGDAMLIE